MTITVSKECFSLWFIAKGKICTNTLDLIRYVMPLDFVKSITLQDLNRYDYGKVDKNLRVTIPFGKCKIIDELDCFLREIKTQSGMILEYCLRRHFERFDK